MERHLQCPICQDIFRQAVEVNCCTKCFCRECISEHVRQSTQATCPNCRKPLAAGDWKENKPLQQLVSDLPIECKFKSNGCNANLTRGIAAEHQAKCDFASVPCPNSATCPRILRKLLPDHLASCPFRPILCQHGCGAKLAPKLLELHVQEQCPNVESKCEACGTSMLRKELEAHDCPAKPSNCMFSFCGCKTKVYRQDLPAHYQTDIVQHLNLAAQALVNLQTSQKQLEQRVNTLEKENSVLKLKLLTYESATASPQPTAAPTSPSIVATSPKVVDDEIAIEKAKARQKSASPSDEAPSQPPSYAIETGVQMVMQLPSELQPKYSKLMRKPTLIVENLLMDGRVDLLRSMQDLLEPQHLDILALQYAQHAMRLNSERSYEAALRDLWSTPSSGGSIKYSTGDSNSRVGRRSGSLSRSGSHPVGLVAASPQQQQQLPAEWKLTGDNAQDERTRSQHAYPNTPDATLAIGILSLCQDASKAAYACLSILEQFTGYVTGFLDFDENLRLVRSMKEILHHAKIQFIKNPAESHSGVLELCDTFLGQLELMEKIISTKAPIQVQLADFSDANRARSLRDKLVDLQLFDLARDFSVRCQLPLDPVWLAWGMLSLRDRKFQEARDVFKHLLTPIDASKSTASPSSATLSASLRRANSVSSKSLVDSQRLVENIIQTLDPGFSQLRREMSPPPQRRSSLSSSSADAAMSVGVNGVSPNVEAIPEMQQSPRLDPESRAECIHYLETYGSRKSALSFFMRHRLLDDCVNFIARVRVDPDLFVDVVIHFCQQHALLNDLKHAIQKQDSSLVTWKTYLLAACKYFNEKKAFKVLVTFQIFMEDFSRAALTCIKVFLDTTDQSHRLKCLEVAKDYFAEAIRRLRNLPPPPTTSSSPASPLSNSRGSVPLVPPPSPGASTVLSLQDMEKYVDRINVQIEILQWIGPRLASDPLLLAFAKLHPSYDQFTLFGPQNQRQVLAWTLLVANTLIGLRIVSDVLKREDWRDTFRTASFYAVRNLNPSQLNEYLRIIKSASSDEWFDVVISPVIEVTIKEKKNVEEAEKLAAKLTGSEAKIDAFVLLGKLKSAYLLAVKSADVSMVKRIMEEAVLINDTATSKLCAKYLELANQPPPQT